MRHSANCLNILRCGADVARPAVAMLLLGVNLPISATAAEPPAAKPLPPVRVLHTPDGTRYGVFGEKPAAPAPTLFVFAGGIEDVDKVRLYSDAGRFLAPEGWITVTLDIPCHGKDHREGEPAGISGWAHRVKAGEDLMGPFTQRCRAVLDHLIAERYTDPQRVGLCGTSRGGFCALHFAAAEPRVRSVTAVSPVTNPLAVSEFQGVTEEQARGLSVIGLAEKLRGRAIWMSIGNHDPRVSTDDCVAAARRFVAEARKVQPPPAVVPVELIVGPSAGHSAIDDAYALAAAFHRRHCAAK